MQRFRAEEAETQKQCAESLVHGHEPFVLPERAPRRFLKVGTILDSFTDLAFGYEWQQIRLTPENWREHYESLDLLFVESAWHGNDDAWQFQLTGSKAPSPELRDLVASCKSSGIPTIFWNKEDPYHFEDFIDTAKIFDWVFTTEAALVNEYKEVLGHDRVDALLFGAQPIIHNPFGRPNESELRDVCFAGTYFSHKFPERQRQIEMLLDGALDSQTFDSKGLEIFSRFRDVSDDYKFPEKYQRFVRGELSYSEMLSAYRAYMCFLNVNSIPDSETMFSRRVFEVLACGTSVISASSPALEPIFGNGILEVDSSEDASTWIKALRMSPNLRDEITYEARMRILLDHTYSHRVDQILKAVGLGTRVLGEPKVSIIAATNRPHQIKHMLTQVGQQVGVEIQLLVGTHGLSASSEQHTFADHLGINVEWCEFDADVSLGAMYNRLIERADFPLIAKFDDDDDYGEFYLLEQAIAIDAMDADLCGKKSHFVRLPLYGEERLAVTYPGQEHCFTEFVSGPTILATAEVMREIGFEDRSRGEDTALLKAVAATDGKIWSTGRYGFTQDRMGDAHTWRAQSEEILRHSKLTDSPNSIVRPNREVLELD